MVGRISRSEGPRSVRRGRDGNRETLRGGYVWIGDGDADAREVAQNARESR